METAAPVIDYAIPDNADFVRTWTTENEDGTTEDYTGYAATGALVSSLGEDGTLILDLTPFLSIDGDEIGLRIPKATLAALSFDKGFWDIVLESPEGEFTRFLQGTMTLDRGATE